jgi:nitrate/nitrite transporter NarK
MLVKWILSVFGALVGIVVGLVQYQHSQFALAGPSAAGWLGYMTGFAIIGAIVGWVIASRIVVKPKKPN